MSAVTDGIQGGSGASPANAGEVVFRLPADVGLDHMRQLVRRHVHDPLRWYQDHAWQSMAMFRSAGVLTIVLGAIVPFIAAVAASHANRAWVNVWILSPVSVAIAVLTGLGTFFQWHTAWHARSMTAHRLELLAAVWDVQMSAANQDNPASLEQARQATEQLLNSATAIFVAERKSFFESVKPPEVGAKGK